MPTISRYGLGDYLAEFDIPGAAGQGDPAAGQAPTTDPYAQTPPATAPDPNVANQPQGMAPKPKTAKDNPDEDPMSPDMPEQKGDQDFETWRKGYMKESVKGDPDKLLDLLNQVRDSEDLQASQETFIGDNYNVQLLRGSDNILAASKEIRGLIKERLDRNNPATSLVTYVTEVLASYPILQTIFVKLNGYGPLRGDLHRKYIAALIGGVQVGIGGAKEDVVYNTQEGFAIYISTRCNYRWGDFYLGDWHLKEDDAERHLSEPELKRLREGSPEEREVLRRRLVIESMSSVFNQRAFVFQVVDEKGSLQTLGWDIATSLRSGYHDGRLVVRHTNNDDGDAQIAKTGEIIPLTDTKIFFVRDTGDQDEYGMPAKEEIPFLENRSGLLFLSAEFDTIRKAANSLPGMILKELPYQGNPSDLRTLKRCVFTCFDMLLKQC